MGEQGAEDEVDLVLLGELLDHLGAALRIRTVIFDHQLDRAARDAAGVVDVFDCGLGGTLVPAPVGCPDTRPVDLEPEPDGRVAAGLGKRRPAGQRGDADRAGKRPSTFQRRPPGQGRRGAVAYPFAVIRAFLH